MHRSMTAVVMSKTETPEDVPDYWSELSLTEEDFSCLGEGHIGGEKALT